MRIHLFPPYIFLSFSELRKGVRCIQSYTRRCMDLQQRNQFNKLYHGTNQFIRDLCNKGEFQEGERNHNHNQNLEFRRS